MCTLLSYQIEREWSVVFSSLLVELVAGVVLFVLAALVVIFRRPELMQVGRFSNLPESFSQNERLWSCSFADEAVGVLL